MKIMPRITKRRPSLGVSLVLEEYKRIYIHMYIASSHLHENPQQAYQFSFSSIPQWRSLCPHCAHDLLHDQILKLLGKRKHHWERPYSISFPILRSQYASQGLRGTDENVQMLFFVNFLQLDSKFLQGQENRLWNTAFSKSTHRQAVTALLSLALNFQ